MPCELSDARRRSRRFAWASRLFLFLVSFLLWAGSALAAFPKDAIPNDFWINWNVPRRWYTGLAMSYRVTVYEIDNQTPTFSLSNAPAGLTVNGRGVLSWASPTAGTYTNIVLQATRPSCNSTNYPGCSTTTSVTFDLEVSTDTTNSFKFFATTGTNNGSCGTLAAPCATLSYLIENRLPGSNNGVTIYGRGGSYTDGWTASVFVGQNYSATDPMAILPYPGESPVINISTANNFGLAIDQGTGYVDIAIPINGNLGASKGNYVLTGENLIVHDVVSGGSRSNDNSAAVVIAGDNAIADRVVSSDNWEPGKTASASGWNNNCFIIYNDIANKTSWVLNSKCYDTEACYKVKHTNCNTANGGSGAGSCTSTTPSRTVFQNLEAINCHYGFLGAGDYSSVRYLITWNLRKAIDLEATDPSSFISGPMLIEHNTIRMASNSDFGFGTGSDYLNTGPITLRRNLVFNDAGACQNQNWDGTSNTRAHAVHWYYKAAAIARAYPFTADYNLYYNSAGDTSCWQIGNTGAADAKNFTDYKALTGASITRDPNSIITNPSFSNVASGLLYITGSSPAATDCGSGEFCGAFKPDRSDYGTVGNQNTTLLEWFVEGGAAPSVGSGGKGVGRARQGGRVK